MARGKGEAASDAGAPAGKAKATGDEEKGSGGIPMVILVALLALRHYSKWIVDVPVISCEFDMPIVVERSDVADDATISALLAQSMAHPDSQVQALNSETFSRTRGFVIKFNRDGVHHLRDEKSPYHFLIPYFDLAAMPEANAFVLNVLIIPPAPAGEEAPAVGMHLDNVVAIDSPRQYIAHAVSVLYLQVPDGMQGGLLQIFFKDGRNGGAVPPGELPSHVVKPVRNKLVTFRGDAAHQITAAHHEDTRVEGGMERVSLVLEQYCVPEGVYDKTVEFTVNRDSDHREYSKLLHTGAALYSQVSQYLVIGLMVLGLVSVGREVLSAAQQKRKRSGA